jgi:CheY-like chemotaxis protein
MDHFDTPPVVMIAASQPEALVAALSDEPVTLAQTDSGKIALEMARDLRPDAILLAGDLRDMSAMDACDALHSDPEIGRQTPILLLTESRPTPTERVAAVRAGAWDFVRYPGGGDELALKLQSYVQAKRNLATALAEGIAQAERGLHTRGALAHRARELGALMGRVRQGLACVVFVLDRESGGDRMGTQLSRSTRVSDVVGVLSPNEIAVLAPGTNAEGAVNLARRLGKTLGVQEQESPRPKIRAGYEVVENLRYWPVDPLDLLSRAARAVEMGTPDAASPWLRRFPAPPAPRGREGHPGARVTTGLVPGRERSDR